MDLPAPMFPSIAIRASCPESDTDMAEGTRDRGRHVCQDCLPVSVSQVYFVFVFVFVFRGAFVEFCAFALLYQPCPGDNIDIVPRTGVADTCQTNYGQTGPTLHAVVDP